MVFADIYKMAYAVTNAEESGDMDWSSQGEEKKEYGADQAWRTLAEETARRSGTAKLKQFIAGGELVRRLNWAHAEKIVTWMIRQRRFDTFDRNQVAWSWDAAAPTLRGLVDATVFTALDAGQQAGHKRIGVLLIFDTEMVENATLEELQEVLTGIKIRVDARNKEQETDHYVMVAQCLYYKTLRHRHADARVASANAVICAFNTFMGKRLTLDLNHLLLGTEEGRPLNIRGEALWKVDQKFFKGQEISEGTLLEWINRIYEFLESDDGERQLDANITYPCKKDGKGNIKYLPNFKVETHIERNTMNIVTKGVDPEALYWVRTRLLRHGLNFDQLPAMPQLNLCAYALKPVKKGQTVGTLSENEEESIKELRREEEKATHRELALSGRALLDRVLDLASRGNGGGEAGDSEPEEDEATSGVSILYRVAAGRHSEPVNPTNRQ